MEPEEHQDTWPTAEMEARSIAQARALRLQAKEGGLRFEVYLPPELADWLLGLMCRRSVRISVIVTGHFG